jgi:hypothetical protein
MGKILAMHKVVVVLREHYADLWENGKFLGSARLPQGGIVEELFIDSFKETIGASHVERTVTITLVFTRWKWEHTE